MSVTRRGFMQLFAGAIAAAQVGITLAPSEVQQPHRRRLHARHLYTYDIHSVYAPCWVHRLEVKFDDQQWGVDFMTQNQKVDPKRELAPALAMLNNAIAKRDYEVGEIFTYSMNEWQSNHEAQKRWGRIGDGKSVALNG